MDTLGPLLANLAIFFAITVALMIYFCAVLWIIARKLGDPQSWMAWIPIINLILMCRLARKPMWYLVLCIIPLINLVALVLLWRGIAQARGKSPALGFLMLIPLVNLVVPLIIASGPMIASPPSEPAPPAQAPPQMLCPACGRPECVGEDFCGYTGHEIKGRAPIPHVPPGDLKVPKIENPAEPQPGVLAKVILGLVLTFGATYFGMGLLASAKKFLGYGGANTGGAPPANVAQAATNALPQRASGTLKEFPVDTASNPARPTSVVSQSLRGKSGPIRPKLPPRSLPAKFPADRLPSVADAITTATYQASPADPPVSVHVLNTTASSEPTSYWMSHLLGGGAETQTTAIQVQSPSGAEYKGYRVRTPQDETFILDKQGAPTTIVIFAPDPSVKTIAERLAANVGNGEGLLDDPTMTASLSALPQLPGLDLAESESFTGANLAGALEQLTGSVQGSFGPEARQYVDQAKRFLPPQLSRGRYLDSAGREFNMLVGDYGGAASAWSTWQLIRTTLGLSGMQPVDIRGGTAIGMTEQGSQSVLFRRGKSLGFVTGPDDRVVRLAELTRE